MKIETLFEAWHGSCVYCGTKLKINPEGRGNRFVPTRDNFIPIAAGGGNGKRNTVLACQPCNTRKGSFDPRVLIKVWHDLDPKALSAFLASMAESKPRRSFAGRIRALLRPKSPAKRLGRS